MLVPEDSPRFRRVPKQQRRLQQKRTEDRNLELRELHEFLQSQATNTSLVAIALPCLGESGSLADGLALGESAPDWSLGFRV